MTLRRCDRASPPAKWRFALITAGLTYGEIARELVISEKTVSTHVSHLLAKTGTANTMELSGLARRTGT